jgi:hypothetical protein
MEKVIKEERFYKRKSAFSQARASATFSGVSGSCDCICRNAPAEVASAASAQAWGLFSIPAQFGL